MEDNNAELSDETNCVSTQNNDTIKRFDFIEDKRREDKTYWILMSKKVESFEFKHISKFTSVILLGLLTWIISLMVIPSLAKPGGKLFDIALLTLSAYLVGKLLFKLTTLPALIGMLFMGILLQNINFVNLEGDFSKFTSELRRIALVIILTRAGLSLDQPTIKRLLVGVLKLGLIPWLAECVIMAILAHYFLSLPWNWGFLLSSIIASVSPAVVVPCFIKLQKEGYGSDKGIPTLVLAAASIDDTMSIAIYGIISSIMFTESSILNNILQGPISILGGIGFGIFWGFVVAYIPHKSDSQVAAFRVIMLFLGGYMSVLAFNYLGYAGAGPLAVISAAFVSGFNWSKGGWDAKNNPAINSFRSLWLIFEPILFGLTGTLVKLNELESHIVTVGTICLFSSVILRVIVTIIICYGSNFNFKEKLFVGLSWMAKATVQAALGPLAIESVKSKGDESEEMKYAKIILMICILSIALTAPIGALLISITGPRLLTKSECIIGNQQQNLDEDMKIEIQNLNDEILVK